MNCLVVRSANVTGSSSAQRRLISSRAAINLSAKTFPYSYIPRRARNMRSRVLNAKLRQDIEAS